MYKRKYRKKYYFFLMMINKKKYDNKGRNLRNKINTTKHIGHETHTVLITYYKTV